jgi:hypothetical protein
LTRHGKRRTKVFLQKRARGILSSIVCIGVHEVPMKALQAVEAVRQQKHKQLEHLYGIVIKANIIVMTSKATM